MPSAAHKRASFLGPLLRNADNQVIPIPVSGALGRRQEDKPLSICSPLVNQLERELDLARIAGGFADLSETCVGENLCRFLRMVNYYLERV
jgi:hypothetical protein